MAHRWSAASIRYTSRLAHERDERAGHRSGPEPTGDPLGVCVTSGGPGVVPPPVRRHERIAVGVTPLRVLTHTASGCHRCWAGCDGHRRCATARHRVRQQRRTTPSPRPWRHPPHPVRRRHTPPGRRSPAPADDQPVDQGAQLVGGHRGGVVGRAGRRPTPRSMTYDRSPEWPRTSRASPGSAARSSWPGLTRGRRTTDLRWSGRLGVATDYQHKRLRSNRIKLRSGSPPSA